MKKLTVILAAFAMVAAFAMSASAADWNFYGSARIATFVHDVGLAEGTTNVAGENDDQDLMWENYTNARIGANVKANDSLSGRFEYGTGHAGKNPNLRLLYGTWNFGGGALTVGQFWSPGNQFLSSQGGGINGIGSMDAGMLNTGGFYSGREQGLQLTFGDFQIALIKTETFGAITGMPAGDTDIILPKIEASYHLDLDAVYLDFNGIYNTYDVDTATETWNVHSYATGVAFGANFGSAFIKTSVWYGVNVGNLMWNITADDPIVNTAGELIDNESYGLLFVAGTKISDMLSFEGGVGYNESELDQTGATEDDNLAYYVNAKITLAPGVFIVPEIGVIDYQDDSAGVDQGDVTYYGAKWQLNF